MSILLDRTLKAESREGRYFNKHTHFAKIYEELFAPWLGKKMTLVELGVSHGGSLQLWREYLGGFVDIIGLDVAEHCLYNEHQITCHLVDQSKQEDLNKIATIAPSIDFFIDDGSHNSEDQIATFETVFPLISRGGTYVCEDVHTSYRELYHMGYKNPGSFIEYCKNIIDSAYHNESDQIIMNKHSNEIASITFHFAMVVIKKI